MLNESFDESTDELNRLIFTFQHQAIIAVTIISNVYEHTYLGDTHEGKINRERLLQRQGDATDFINVCLSARLSKYDAAASELYSWAKTIRKFIDISRPLRFTETLQRVDELSSPN